MPRPDLLGAQQVNVFQGADIADAGLCGWQAANVPLGHL
jgi:hypothetical protein